MVESVHDAHHGGRGETGNRIFCAGFFLPLNKVNETRKANGDMESTMKTFLDAQMKCPPSIVKVRRTSRVANRFVTWATIAIVGLLANIAYTVPSFAQILGTAQLNVERRGHSATLLEDGRVLIVGGDNLNGVVSQAEIVDPVSQTSSLAASITARTDHTATRLSDGRVLV